SKYLFQVQSLLGEELESEMQRQKGSETSDSRGGSIAPVHSPDTGRRDHAGQVAAVVRLIGHADLRWHLWIVLALFGRLDLALVSYAAYFALRAIAGGVRKAVRYA